ncbi:MAG: menaquinone biosynthesis protein [Thermodesulfovibrionia bacterium]
MKRALIRIGRIPYANLFPFFYYLENQCDSSLYRFINGHPSELNRLLRHGHLDISPSSSIEYLRNKDRYSLIPFLSISSIGRIDSIMLLSNEPIDELDGKTISLSSDSDTSVVLLKILLKEFKGIRCRFTMEDSHDVNSILSKSSAMLLIGDTAMKEAKRFRRQKTGDKRQRIYIYDLGEMWHRYTGLPFVFALWIVRNDVMEKKWSLVKRLSLDLYNAKGYLSKNLPLIADMAPQRDFLTKRELINYWGMLSFDLTERHLEGLRLFEHYCLKNHLF